MSHTRGPWTIYQPRQYISIRAANGEFIIEGRIANRPGIEDARLIAAAPELLAALQATIRALEGQPSPKECRNDRWIDETLISARAAIRKATGDA